MGANSGYYCSSHGVFCEYANVGGFCTLSSCKSIEACGINTTTYNSPVGEVDLESKVKILEARVAALEVLNRATKMSQIVVADQGNRVRIPMDFFKATGINPLDPVLVSMDINDKTIKLSAIPANDLEKAKEVVCKSQK